MKSTPALAIALLSMTVSASRKACTLPTGSGDSGYCVVYEEKNWWKPTKERYACLEHSPCLVDQNGCYPVQRSVYTLAKCSG
ncbi:hypothetical protein Vi05172_g9140 [Venturia inaequalis]|nr:hypothetical protein Vi05172_g9140 [Venturia inaequalis]